MSYNINSKTYNDDPVSAEELQALLDELQGAGGETRKGQDAEKMLFGGRKGSVGSTTVLGEQAGLRNGEIKFVDRRSSHTSTATFSTYSKKNNIDLENDTMFTNNSCGRPTPLGVRLAPLGVKEPEISPLKKSLNVNNISSRDSSSPLKRPAPPTQSSSVSNSGRKSGRNSFQPLPALSGGLVEKDPILPERQNAINNTNTSANANFTPPPEVKAAAGVTDVGERETNFMPIMCARYLKPSGLTPSGRWGHTLTAVGTHTLYCFGGMEVNGKASNLLCEFNHSTISWDPVLVLKGSAPLSRHSHAACTYEDRYLILFGGTANPEAGGGSAAVAYNDIHMFDTVTKEWSCIFQGSPGKVDGNKNIPSPRFGHSMVLREDRLYIFGGRSLKLNKNNKIESFVVAPDVYIFSLNSKRWKKRIRISSTNRKSSVAAEGGFVDAQGTNSKKEEQVEDAENGEEDNTELVIMKSDPRKNLTTGMPRCPAPRAYHSACIKGDVMYINGGGGAETFNDTWSINLCGGDGEAVAWIPMHPGASADAIPREKHSLFVCGEALLVIGGCTASTFNDRIAGKYMSFAAVLPLFGQTVPCWMPICMGNVSITPPLKRGFGSAFVGGFVYVFGGTNSSAEPCGNNMVRFLAADGYLSADKRSTTAAGDNALRAVLQMARQRPVVPFDTFISISSWGGSEISEANVVGVHRLILQQRAPAFLAALEECRSEPMRGGGVAANKRKTKASTKSPVNAAGNGVSSNLHADEEGDLLDHFVERVYDNTNVESNKNSSEAGTVSKDKNANNGSSYGTIYYTMGNTRVKGLPHALNLGELEALLDYIYWGGLSSEFRVLLDDEKEDNKEGSEGTTQKVVGKTATHVSNKKDELQKTISVLQTAATHFVLPLLSQLCAALLSKSRKQLCKAREACTVSLRQSMLSLLDSGNLATCTVLFVDPHTGQQTAHALHPLLLTSANPFFADLLRPLYNGDCMQFQIGPVAAKVTLNPSPGAPFNGLLASNSKRAILIGPVSIPKLSIPVVLKFLYSMALVVPHDLAFDVMLASHVLNMPPLQAYSETVVARNEVNYDTCCSFYHLAGRYNASLLEEMCLLTAVSGYSEVQHSLAYVNLDKEHKQQIDALVHELNSDTWVPAPQPSHELKSAAEYEARWKSSGQ